MKNLIASVLKVMSEVKGMEKNSIVGTGQYKYSGTKDSDVKEVFNTALQKNGLIMMPIDIDEHTQVDRWDEGGKTKQLVFTKVKVKYLLAHESGESVEIVGYGHGVDAQDKGAGKATTYAMKNALLYTFLTPVGKIDDTDETHSRDLPVPKKHPEPLNKPKKKKLEVQDKLTRQMTPQWKNLLEAIGNGTVTELKQISEFYEFDKETEKMIEEQLNLA